MAGAGRLLARRSVETGSCLAAGVLADAYLSQNTLAVPSAFSPPAMTGAARMLMPVKTSSDNTIIREWIFMLSSPSDP